MVQTAKVIDLLPNNKAVLLIERHTSCSHYCSKCNACMSYGKYIKVNANNNVNAQIGDTVKVESDTGSILRIAAVVYILPIMLFFVFYFSSKFFLGVYPSLFGIGGFIFGFFLAFLYNKSISKRSGIKFNIIKIYKEFS